MQTHSQAFRHYKQEEVLHLQPIETYRHARLVSVLVGNIDATGQVLIGAMYLQMQRMQPRMKGLQCIPPARLLAEGHARSQIHLHTSFTCCDPFGLHFANMQRRPYSVKASMTLVNPVGNNFLPSKHYQ